MQPSEQPPSPPYHDHVESDPRGCYVELPAVFLSQIQSPYFTVVPITQFAKEASLPMHLHMSGKIQIPLMLQVLLLSSSTI